MAPRATVDVEFSIHVTEPGPAAISVAAAHADTEELTVSWHGESELAEFDNGVAASHEQARSAYGEVRVKRQIVGFKKIKFYTLENVGAGNLSLPEQEMHTTAFWLRFEMGFFNDFNDFSETDLQDALHGLGSVLKTVATVLLLSDPRDLAVAVLDDSAEPPNMFEPDVVLYDNYPGGIGQSQPLFRRSKELLQGALELAAVQQKLGSPEDAALALERGLVHDERSVEIERHRTSWREDRSERAGFQGNLQAEVRGADLLVAQQRARGIWQQGRGLLKFQRLSFTTLRPQLSVRASVLFGSSQ